MSTHTIHITMGPHLIAITFNYYHFEREISFYEAVFAVTGEAAPIEIQNLAADWITGDGYDYALDCAETDLNAMRHAQ